MFDLLEIIAKIADSSKKYSSDISSVSSSFILNNYSCDSAPQQEVNGVYRCVEMLNIIAGALDTRGFYSSSVSSVMSSYGKISS